MTFTKTFLVIAILSIVGNSFGQIIPYTGLPIYTPFQGAPVLINQTGLPNPQNSVTALSPGPDDNDQAVLNRITLGVDLNYKKYFGSPMKVRVRMQVERWDSQANSLPDTTVHLEVFYNPFTDSTYISKESARFSGSYSVKAVLDSVYVNDIYNDTLPANIYITNEILINRRTAFTALDDQIEFEEIIALNTDCDQDEIMDNIHLDWTNSTAGILEYQLEWLYINNYGSDTTNSNLIIDPADLKYNFKYNSTRITTSEQDYDLSLVFDKGWVIFRLRGVGVNSLGEVVYGDWNLPEVGNVDDAIDHRFEVEQDMRHQNSLNWQYSATYAEEGKKKEIISYFDGSLRNRQTVTSINTDQNIIVGETIYDYQGRPAINVLPAPVVDPACQNDDPNKSSVLKFYPNFNQNDNLVPTGYSAADFDLSPVGQECTIGAAPMGTQSGSSQYYSPKNPDQMAEQAYVPDANKYPFTQVEYTPDNTGRIRRQSGVGPEFQLGSTHETEYLYGQANQLELDRVFGSEVGDALHYKKNVVIDAHGQASISYLDQEGRVIATALAGNAPTNLQGIGSEGLAPVELTVNAFGQNDSQNKVSIEGNSIVFSTQLLVAYTSEYTFNYDFNIEPLQDECLPNLCIDCVYDLTFELVDQCGIDNFQDVYQQKLVGKFSGDETSGYTFHGVCIEDISGTDNVPQITIPVLKPGSYSFNKRLTINDDARQAFIDLYLDESLNGCIKSYQDFLDEEMALIDSSDCQVTCEQCFEELGTLEDYIAAGNGTANDYYLQKEDCERVCNGGNISFCEVAYNMMQMDMAVGGQYGEYQNSSGQTDLSTHLLSIYRTPNSLPVAQGTPSWKFPKLIDQYGVHPIYKDLNGDTARVVLTSNGNGGWIPAVANSLDIKYDAINDENYVYPEELLSGIDFINNFQFSWAKSLVIYHPEYCYYENCISYGIKENETDVFTSDSFDDLLENTTTFQEAVENGFLPQGYSVIFTSSGNATVNVSSDTENWLAPTNDNAMNDDHAWDPFVFFGAQFSNTDCINAGSTLSTKFNNYRIINGIPHSMSEIAAYMARCGDNYYTNPPTTCFNFGGPVSGQYDIDILNKEWNILKALYRSQKQQLKQELADCIALTECNQYCGCIGNEDFNPFTSGMIEPFNFSDPTAYFNSPYFQSGQPCGSALHNLFEQKDRRFQNAVDVVPIQNANEAAYEVYLATGQCPVPFTLQGLLTSLAVDDRLDNSMVVLNDYGSLNALFQADNDFNMPGTIPNLTQIVSTSGNTITSNWIQNPGGSTYATLTMTKSLSGISWDQLSSIINLYPTGGTNFEAQGLYGTNQTLNLTGSLTTFDIQGCSFANECTLNELGSDLEELLSALASSDKLTSTINVDIDPLVISSSSITGLQTLLIENAANSGSNLSWVKFSPNEFKLFNASSSSNEGLYFTFTSSDPSGFNWNNLTQVDYFDNMLSDGQNLFNVDAHLNNGTIVNLNGSIIRKNSLNEQTGIAIGECELPVPAECQTKENQAFDALYNVLNEVLVTNSFDGTQSVNLFNSMYLESSITNQWDPNLTSTTSAYSSSSDILLINAGECQISLTAEGPFNLTQIASFEVMSAAGTTDNFFNYHDFQIKVMFENGAGGLTPGYVNGTSCLSIQPCFGCIPEVITLQQLDSIRQQRLANGEFYIDNSIDLYNLYTAAIDSFNLVNGYSSTDSNFVLKKEYNYFSKNGFNFPTPGFLRFIAHTIPGLDNLDMLKDPDKYVANYGYGTNVLFEYDRYLESINRYNTRANQSGAQTLSPITKVEFVDAKVARNNGEFLLYIETTPTGTQSGQNILTYFNASTSVVTPDHVLYKQYTDAYLLFESAQLNGTGPQCVDYKKFSPMYSFEDIVENKLLCTNEGRLQLTDYISSFSTGCPGVLPERKNCLPASANVTMRDDQKLYILYKESVKEFNQSLWATSNNFTLPFAFQTVHQFVLSGYKRDCLKQYQAYLSLYKESSNPSQPSLPPLAITEFAPCNGIVQPEEPCKEAFSDYMDCLTEFNQWALNTEYAYFIKQFPTSYESFLRYDVCNCIGEFCARINQITTGLVEFTNPELLDQYLDFTSICDKPCQPEQHDSLPVVALEIPAVDDCLEMQHNQAVFNAQHDYSEYIDSLTNELVNMYNSHCLTVNEDLTYTYKDKLYHFTLYYYDQAGNLIKTIPPAGVEKLNTTNSNDQISTQIANDRSNGTKTVYTSHRLATRYEYNSLNQLVAQSTPDTDPMNIFELTLPNGLHSKLITRKIQMVNENIGYLAGEVPAFTGTGPVRGYLYKTSDGGITWSRVYNLVGSDLKKAVMITEDLGFAIGTNGIVLKTVDGGNTWDMLNSWTTSGMITDLNDITYVDNGSGNYTVTVVGNNGLIAQSTDLQTFTAVSVGANWNVSSITKSTTHYFATANENGYASIFTKPLGTGSWAQSNDFTAGSMHAVDITSGNRAIIGGADGRLFVNSDISNTASRWKMIETDVTGTFTDLNFFNDNVGVAILDGKLYRTVNAGANWDQLANENYNHLSESQDGASILAVGPNSKMALVVNSNDPQAPIIPVNFQTGGLNITAGWVDRVVSGTSSTTTAVIAIGANLHVSYNASEPVPTWTPYPLTSVVSGSIKDIKLERISGSPLQLKGVLLSSTGKLIRFYTNPPANNVNASVLYIAGPTYKTIDKATTSNNVFCLNSTGTVVRINYINPTPNPFTIATGVTTNHECMVLKGNSMIFAGDQIRRVATVGGIGGGITIQTTKTNPVFLRDVSFQNNTAIATGNDGTIYRLETGIWKLLRTNTNQDIYAASFHSGYYYFAGESGYLTKGTIASTIYTPTSINLTTGGTVETGVTENLHDLTLNGDRMYAVGENGRMLYSPNPSSSPFANLSVGTQDLFGITPKVNSLKVIAVGKTSGIYEIAGASYVQKKDLFTPEFVDVHFISSTIGTVLGDDFTVRKTFDGGTTWTTIRPEPSITSITGLADFKNTWTIDNNQSIILGNGTGMVVNSAIAFTQTTLPNQVTGIYKKGNYLYATNTNSIVKIDLVNFGTTTLSSFPEQVNDLHVFNNGTIAAVGNGGVYMLFDNLGSLLQNTVLIPSENLNDIHFIDNVYGVIVGNNGSYFKTNITTVDAFGNLTAATWVQQQDLYNSSIDPLSINNSNQVNIYTIAFATPTNGIFGGEYNISGNPSLATLPNCYVRNVFDPNSRYSSRFFYDRLGRLVVSQNARQYNTTDVLGNQKDRKFSYTLYDALGRVVEVGEKTENPPTNTGADVKFKDIFGTTVSGYFNPSVMDDNRLLDWVTGLGERREVTKSYYDVSIITIADSTLNFTPNPLTQRKRITHITYETLFDGNDQTYEHATHYDYDIHGNVKTLLQDNQKMAVEFPSIADQRYKRMDYSYDLVSGNVHRMSVQNGETDQWHHAYRYDADNRIISAHTNKETPILANSALPQSMENELVQNTDWQQDAKYFYYDHGPLARTELGDQQLQGMDYIYNLQGWMKGVNATNLDQNLDPGRDGSSTALGNLPNNPNEIFAKDVMAFSLHYFENDYAPIGAGGVTPLITALPAANISNSDVAANTNDLFNGNIKAMQTTLTNPTSYDAMPMANAYQYDQLNRLLSSKSFINLSGNQWGNSGTYDNRYLNTFEYDAMGNIVHQNRYTEAGVQIENMSYGYKQDSGGKLLRNRLYHINEPTNLSSLDDTDIDDMGGTFNPQAINIETAYNYAYDEEGRLIKDSTEKINLIVWRVDGKVKEIHRPQNSDKKNISFDYDAMGNRIAKHVYDDDWNLEASTYYLLDAQGNQMSVYEHEVVNSNVSYSLKERHIYGSSSVGIMMDSISMGYSTSGNTSTELGLKTYSMSNHLGNVLTVISDIKIPTSTDNLSTTGFRVGIRNISDYSAFGVLLKERTVESEFFRLGFNGEESVAEVSGEKNSYDYGNRFYNPRIGKFLSLDVYAAKYPSASPYTFALNSPITNKDIGGDSVLFFSYSGEYLGYSYDNTRYKNKNLLVIISDKDVDNFNKQYNIKRGMVDSKDYPTGMTSHAERSVYREACVAGLESMGTSYDVTAFRKFYEDHRGKKYDRDSKQIVENDGSEHEWSITMGYDKSNPLDKGGSIVPTEQNPVSGSPDAIDWAPQLSWLGDFHTHVSDNAFMTNLPSGTDKARADSKGKNTAFSVLVSGDGFFKLYRDVNLEPLGVNINIDSINIYNDSFKDPKQYEKKED
jgi:RHS repeat-associated protein